MLIKAEMQPGNHGPFLWCVGNKWVKSLLTCAGSVIICLIFNNMNELQHVVLQRVWSKSLGKDNKRRKSVSAILRSVFPSVFTREKHAAVMQQHLPKIVAMHSSGNVALQTGHYATSAKLERRHACALKVLQHG